MDKNQLILSVRRMLDFEIAFCETLNRKCHPTVARNVFVVVSTLGDGAIWYALMLALPIIYGQSGLATSWNMIRIAVVNLVLYKIIKQLSGRARPCAVSAHIALGTAPLDQYSFPSGHTMHAVAFSIVIASQHGELGWALVPFSSLIALSRIALGLHYPTDVIAGAVIGGSVASILAGC
jgi:undecaprenyl-diphosphatase